MNDGIFGGSKPIFNDELIKLAKKEKLELPENYYPALLNHQYLKNDFAKYTKSYAWNPNPAAWEAAKNVFERMFKLKLSSKSLTFDETVDHTDYMLSASPGFPWNKKYKTKRDCLENERVLIKSIIDRIFDDGIVSYDFLGEHYDNVFWLTSPKSEIRDINKLNNADPKKRKTRTFMCGDIITHTVGFMLYKNQNDSLIAYPAKDSWIAVGMNPWYGGWDRLCKSLLRNGSDSFHCYDASHMEASVSSAVQGAIYDVRNAAIRNAAQTRVAQEWFQLQVTNSLIIDVDGRLCMKFGKNPSGNFNTLVDNTFALFLVFLYTIASFLLQIFSLSGIEDRLFSMARDTAAAMLGDDSIFEDVPCLANLECAASEIGFDLKPETAPGPLSKCTFLSSQFFYHTRKRMWIQKAAFGKVMANLYYNFKNNSWRYVFVKLCAARKIFFAFEDERSQIDSLLRYVSERHDVDMRDEKSIDEKLTYSASMSQLMSDSQNSFLIFGDESKTREDVLWTLDYGNSYRI
jgi:hypothetical protein